LLDKVTLRVDKKPLSQTLQRLSVDKKRHFQTTERLTSTKKTDFVDTMTLLQVKKPLSHDNERRSHDNERHLQSGGRHLQTTKRHPVTKVRFSVMTVTQPLDNRTTSWFRPPLSRREPRVRGALERRRRIPEPGRDRA